MATMKNRALAIVGNSIPYCKDVRRLTQSVTAAILMQQMEFWFSSYEDGFYKFLSPVQNNSFYKDGDSWTEELGFSEDEFRTAFDKIGVRYKSKTEFDQAEDKFQGRFYCSYHDKIKGLTMYYRNHEIVDAAIDKMLTGIASPRKSEKPGYVDRQTQPTETGIAKPDVNRETTVTETGNPHPEYTETTHRLPDTTPLSPETSSESGEQQISEAALRKEFEKVIKNFNDLGRRYELAETKPGEQLWKSYREFRKSRSFDQCLAIQAAYIHDPANRKQSRAPSLYSLWTNPDPEWFLNKQKNISVATNQSDISTDKDFDISLIPKTKNIEAQKIWLKASKIISQQISPNIFPIFFTDCVLVKASSSKMIFVAPDKIARHLQRNYTTTITDAIKTILKKDVIVEIFEASKYMEAS